MTKKTNKTKPLWTPRVPRALYSTGHQDLETRRGEYLNAPEEKIREFKVDIIMEALRFAEGLIVAPSVCTHVWGENYVLCHLITCFGVKGVEQLLEEGALEFLLWASPVNYISLTSPGDVKGLDPLTPGHHTSPAHCDPQASVELGLKGAGKVPWPQLERLAKLAIEKTHVSAKNVSQDAVQAVRKAYDRGALRRYGFDPSVPRYDLSEDQRGKLSGLAEDIAKGMVLHSLDVDVHESELTWKQLLRMRDIVGSHGAVKAVEAGLRVENLPNIPAVMLAGVLQPKDIVDIRNHQSTQELRKWLWEQPDPHNAEAVAKAWLATITDKPLKDKTWFKTVRVAVATVVGLAAPAALGAAAEGIISGGALGYALGAADTFGVEKLLTKPSPRRFADLLRQKMAEHKAPAQLPQGNRKQRRAKKSKQRKST
ncbi:MAG: hypothetical protein IPM54_11480 [Polyangiaceae bacterium]|nr:hypothetical protein [Polyangiaceae bacterium]